MSFIDKLKGLFGQAKHRAADVATDLADKAAPVAAKGIDAAAAGVDKVTGGRFHEQIEGVTTKVEDALDRGNHQS
jgi:hypothetical protein